MDQETRNKLQRATQQVRRILEEEFEQLEGTFDILPSGKILPEPGKHLDAGQRLIQQKLVDTIEHIRAGGRNPQEAVDEYTCEAAFTFLNRFVALRMLEARSLLQECVSKGDQSSGFKEFCGLAPGLSTLPDDGYQLYLECLFDELSIEVKVLFNRRDPASLLWPRRQALIDVLATLGQSDLAGIWSDDETIGWVYQYFNSDDDRKDARYDDSGKPKVPQNSHDLAVRNQFFTPRYVVKFLTDNTLGRIWYEMQKGETRLADECRYLVRRPREVFLEEGQELPQLSISPDGRGIEGEGDEAKQRQDFSQIELLKEPAYIPHRPKKDPRDLKILDPACGSGHFLLYTFDLLITIYEEAWGDESSAESESTGRRLRDDFAELQQLHAALPGLVLGHNLFGIDIDHRAAQIAALALWMRGLRAFKDLAVTRNSRPLIAKSNIVCAEPMPGETSLLDEFVDEELSSDSETRLLAQLVHRVFDGMKLAGEVGSLLRIEKHVSDAVSEAKKQWKKEPAKVQRSLFDVSEGIPAQREFAFDIAEITDERFWDSAEQRIYLALRAYAERAATADLGRRLFSEDTARGFAFVNSFRRRYDVVLMNPPFGDASIGARNYIAVTYPDSSSDLGMSFVDRFSACLDIGGRLGAITNRVFIANETLKTWRDDCLLNGRSGVSVLLDLGYGILDDAKVEAAAYVVGSASSTAPPAIFLSVLNAQDKPNAALSLIHGKDTRGAFLFTQRLRSFFAFPGHVLAYQLPPTLAERATGGASLESRGGIAAVGLQTSDDFRFVRLAWEVPQESVGRGLKWPFFAKGGEYRPYWDDIHLVVNWGNEGVELKNFRDAKGKPRPYPRNMHEYYRAGVTWPQRTTSDLSPRVLPADIVFSIIGQAIFCGTSAKDLGYIAGAYSRAFKLVIDALYGSGDASSPSSMANQYRSGVLAELPPPVWDAAEKIEDATIGLVRDAISHFDSDETSRLFTGKTVDVQPVTRQLETEIRQTSARVMRMVANHAIVEAAVFEELGFDETDRRRVDALVGPHPSTYRPVCDDDLSEIRRLWQTSESELIRIATEKHGARRQLTMKSFVANRRYELVAHIVEVDVGSLADAVATHQLVEPGLRKEVAARSISWATGVAFGRWDFGFANGRLSVPERADIFSALPPVAPGILAPTLDEGNYEFELPRNGILVDDTGHPDDIAHRVRAVLHHEQLIGNREATTIEEDACDAFGVRTLEEYFRKPTVFFEGHIKRDSKSRRRAPIYWQLATPSAFYSVWLYYHRFTKDTFFKVLKEYVRPKLGHERQKLDRLPGEAGPEPTRSQRKEIEDQEKFVAELAAMAEEVERIAPLWNPDLNDGVIVNFAPLWRLVPQNKSWQKECKKIWDKLVAGDYDWAHLAMHLWPERVVPKCVTDASLAIAHGLEDVFWQQDDRDRFQPKEEPEGGWQPVIDRLVAEQTSAAVKAALDSLLTAPTPVAKTKRRSRKRS